MIFDASIWRQAQKLFGAADGSRRTFEFGKERSQSFPPNWLVC